MSKLFNKYAVERIDGIHDPYDSAYFVLRLNGDHAARVAALAYAEEIAYTDPELAVGIRQMVARFDTIESGGGITRIKAEREKEGGQ